VESLLLDGSFELNEGWDTTPVPWIDGQYNMADANNPPLWEVTAAGSGVDTNDPNAWASGSSYDGENYMRARPIVDADRGLFQILSATLEADTDYEITLVVGNYLHNITEGNPTGAVGNYRVELVAGGVLIASVSGASPAVNGTWEPASLSFTSGANPAQLGETLEIRILAEAYDGFDGADICFDAVTFTIGGVATHVTPPQEGMITVTVTVALNDVFNPTPVVDTMTIDVYDTACQAIRDGANQGVNNLTDIDGDCNTTLIDFAAIAANWMIDTSSTGPVDLE
jgi:hypothetical protein